MTTDWRSDVNTKEGKKHFKVALRAGLKQSALKRNFRQDSLFWCVLLLLLLLLLLFVCLFVFPVHLLCKRGKVCKVYKVCLQSLLVLL